MHSDARRRDIDLSTRRASGRGVGTARLKLGASSSTEPSSSLGWLDGSGGDVATASAAAAAILPMTDEPPTTTRRERAEETIGEPATGGDGDIPVSEEGDVGAKRGLGESVPTGLASGMALACLLLRLADSTDGGIGEIFPNSLEIEDLRSIGEMLPNSLEIEALRSIGEMLEDDLRDFRGSFRKSGLDSSSDSIASASAAFCEK
jgi:hypothetical protein